MLYGDESERESAVGIWCGELLERVCDSRTWRYHYRILWKRRNEIFGREILESRMQKLIAE